VFAVPFDIKSIELDYLRKPLIPVFDWCQDANNPNRIIYMPEGSFIKATFSTLPGPGGGTIINTVDLVVSPSDYTIIQSNVIKGTWIPGVPFTNQQPYTSKTVELEWEAYMHHKFVSRLLKFVGVNLGEAEVEKFAIMQQQNT
jgi:hypothetical protein